MISIADRRILLPLIALLTGLAVGLALRHSSTVAGCEVPATAQVERTGQGNASQDGPCVEVGAQQSPVSFALAQPPVANSEPLTAAAPGSPIDPLFALSLSIWQGSSVLLSSPRLSPKTPNLHWPLVGPITQPFGVPELGVGPPHTGVDIGVSVGTPVRSAAAGVVTFADGDPSTGYGYYAIVDHGGGVSTLYGHFMRPPIVLAGDYVTQGQVIGFSGTTGFSTGPHLHFEVRLGGIPIDPMSVLPSR